jgi:hypothetical protein
MCAADKIKSWFRRLKSWFVRHHEDRLLGLALRDSTPAQWEAIRQEAFTKAKKVSDFTAIIIRAGFIWLFFLYFISAAARAEAWYAYQFLILCGVASFVLYFFLFLQFLRVVAVSFLVDTAYVKKTSHKIVLIIAAIFLTVAAAFGVADLVQAFARISDLLK